MHFRHALIVEDESILALDLHDIVAEMTGGKVTVAATVADAIERVKNNTFDFALLDISLPDGNSFPVADALKGSGTPYVFVTANMRSDVPLLHRGAPLVRKPFHEAAVRIGIAQALLAAQNDPED